MQNPDYDHNLNKCYICILNPHSQKKVFPQNKNYNAIWIKNVIFFKVIQFLSKNENKKKSILIFDVPLSREF